MISKTSKSCFRGVSEEKKQCPDITWKGSFATLGRFDVVDLVEAETPSKLRRLR